MTALKIFKRRHVVASTEIPFYLDGRVIGLYVRVGPCRWSAFDQHGVKIGDYKRSSRARRAIMYRRSLQEGGFDTCRPWPPVPVGNNHAQKIGIKYRKPTLEDA